MTGRHPVRSDTFSVLPSEDQGVRVPWEYTIAELLSDSDYATALYGKWQINVYEMAQLQDDPAYIVPQLPL
ncbi:hypothetical protein [Falsihalocynthiibacter arcticus]|uniref:Uncharacterized protein n=1 Tax=Falsihalocynthiibacter arcticus TaxID=1579316 RepID=A0A126UXQ7_9RHOB|nr:hypothetical protein [Falsihalocynthiibacter arcticus]AML50475.1 hypothetical protein RC74_03605 [Falsihalocynthiibacter arcticus]